MVTYEEPKILQMQDLHMAFSSEGKTIFHGYFDLFAICSGLKNFIREDLHYSDLKEVDFEKRHIGNKQMIISKVVAEKFWDKDFSIVLRYVYTANGEDVEKIVDGKKRKLVKGSAHFYINLYLRKDPHKQIEKSHGPLASFIHKVEDAIFRDEEIHKPIRHGMKDKSLIISHFKTYHLKDVK